jgi:hypothetical protein
VDIMGSAFDMKARLHVDLKIGPNWEDMKPLILPSATPLATPAASA